MNLRIGHLSTFYHSSALLMAGGNLSKAIDSDLQWKLFGTGPAIVNAFERNEIDLAYIGLPPAIIGIERGVPIKCIAGGHIEGTAIAGRAEFKDISETGSIEKVLDQFIGSTIGVPGRGSIHDVIINDYLEKFALKGRIEIINYPWADMITEAVAKGDVAAAVGTPALAVAIIRFSNGRLICPPSEIWPYNPSYGIVASSELIQSRGELLQKFLLLHEDATSFLRTRPDEAAEIISGYVGFIDSKFISHVLSMSPRYCSQLTDEYISCSIRFVKAMKRMGYINREISQHEIFDTALIKSIHPEKEHY